MDVARISFVRPHVCGFQQRSSVLNLKVSRIWRTRRQDKLQLLSGYERPQKPHPRGETHTSALAPHTKPCLQPRVQAESNSILALKP